MNSHKIFWVVVLLLTVVRTALVFFQDVSPEEAYVFLCAQNPAPAYFDGPAGLALSVAALEQIGGGGVLWRMLGPFWALLTGVAAYALARVLGAGERAGWVGLAVSLLPVVNTGGLRVGPDLPALALSSFALVCAWRGFEAEKRAFGWWLGAGVLFGLAVNFSYLVVPVIPLAALFALCSPRHLRFPGHAAGLAAMVLVPAAALIPALRWNAAQDWIPLAGGTWQTFWQFDLSGFGRALFVLLAALSPLVVVALVAIWAGALRGARVHLRARFVFLTALPGVVLGFYFLLRGWDATLLVLLAAPVLIYYFVSRDQSTVRRVFFGAAFVVAAGFSVFASNQGFRAGEGWTPLAKAVRALFLEKTASGEEGIFLIAQDPDLASILGWHLRKDLIPPPGYPTVFTRESQDISNQFALWPGYDDFLETEKVTDEYFTEQKGENPFLGRSALYISREPLTDMPQSIKGAFESVSLLKTFPGSGGTKEPLYIYFCLIYQTLPL